MRHLMIAAGALVTLAAGAAHASTTFDDPGDFLPSFAGDHDPDLDVVFFGVSYDSSADAFHVRARFAGDVDPSRPGLYVIGVNTGTGLIRPFGGIGEPNVIFNQAMLIQKSGAGSLSGHTFSATIHGANLRAVVPGSFLTSTGFAPVDYQFNIWPRNGLGNNNQISDFAPNNATLGAAPEPAAWALMVLGFGAMGGAARRRLRRVRA